MRVYFFSKEENLKYLVSYIIFVHNYKIKFSFHFTLGFIQQYCIFTHKTSKINEAKYNKCAYQNYLLKKKNNIAATLPHFSILNVEIGRWHKLNHFFENIIFFSSFNYYYSVQQNYTQLFLRHNFLF